MSALPLEAITIVNETLDEVEAHRAAIMLRMWHHLSLSGDHEALFGAFGGEAPQTLMQSFFAALRQRVTARWPRLRPPPGLCEHHGPMLERVFGQAMGDVLGTRANRLMLSAWTLTLRDFIAESCRLNRPGY